MKIYARQIAPEYQESPLFLYDELFPDDIAVFGNENYKEHLPEIVEHVLNVLRQGELADVLEHLESWYDWYKNETEAIIDYLPPFKREKYSNNEIHALRNHVIDFSCCVCSRENDIICAILSIVTGEKWDYKCIKGCCQSEWNYIFYPVEKWSQEALKAFEIEYFNEGSEWIIDNGEFNPESDIPSNINGYSIYCTSWNDEGIKKEIADSAGCDPLDVVLYAFDGWIKTEQYKQVM